MSEGTISPTKRFTLPFSTVSGNRSEPFTPDMETAAVFSLAELDRTKGGGLIVKEPEEKIAFIAKTGYPLWVSPWAETVLVFDGLNRSSYNLLYIPIPDSKPFLESLKRSAKTRETHLAFLNDYINYFQFSPTEKGLSVNGLISDPEFLSDFEIYRREATKAVDDEAVQTASLTPIIDEFVVLSEIHELDGLNSSFREDLEGLTRCMKILSKVTNHYVKELRGKIRAVKEEFGVKMKEEEKLTETKTDQLNDDYDVQIMELARSFEKQHLPIQKERMKLGKSRELTLEKIERCKLEARTRAEEERSAAEQRWKQKSSDAKKELSEIEAQLKQKDKELKDLDDRRSLEIFKLRDELEAKVKEARKKLLELEATQDAKILIHRQEIEKLEKQTRLISDQIGRTAKLREANIAQFEKLGIRKELGMEGNALYRVPFYVTCFQAELKKRLFILPPSVANTIGFATKLKGALGMTKVKGLLVSRFKSVASLTDTIQVLMQQNAVFEAEMKELGESANILNLSAMREGIKNGLLCLKNEGWLSEKEYDAIRQKLT